jgi:hypothetical protein
VDVLGGHRGRLARGQHARGDPGELHRAQAEQDLGEQLGEPWLHRHPAREPPRGHRHPAGEHRGDLLVRAVLQQPGEQQVPGLQQGQVLLVLNFARGQQPGGLQVQQGRRHDQEVADLVQVPAAGPVPDVGDELVGDLGQSHLGDVQLVLGDQRQQQVEGALEHVQVHLEADRGRRGVFFLAQVVRVGEARRDAAGEVMPQPSCSPVVAAAAAGATAVVAAGPAVVTVMAVVQAAGVVAGLTHAPPPVPYPAHRGDEQH